MTILATNLRNNIDDAFLRRLQFAIDLPEPREEARLRMWQTMLSNDIPQGDDIDLETLAQQLKAAEPQVTKILDLPRGLVLPTLTAARGFLRTYTSQRPEAVPSDGAPHRLLIA